jgi:hypothetical protein
MLADESVMTADEGDLSGLIRCSDHAGSTPTAPIDRPRLRTSRDFTLPSGEGAQHFPFLALGHLEMIKGEAKLCSDFVEHGRWDLQVEMCIAQLSAGVFKWSSRQRGEPQGSEPLEARHPRVVRLDDLWVLQ